MAFIQGPLADNKLELFGYIYIYQVEEDAWSIVCYQLSEYELLSVGPLSWERGKVPGSLLFRRIRISEVRPRELQMTVTGAAERTWGKRDSLGSRLGPA